MATATMTQSLNNMSVYTDQGPSNQALLMPKLQYRFRVVLENFGQTVDSATLTRQVVDVTRPTVSFQEVTLPVYNSTIYLAGKHTWQAVTLNVRDDALGSITKLVGEQLQKQLDFAQLSSPVSGLDYKFVMRIEALDGGNGTNLPIVLEAWELGGCFISTVNYNNFNYANSDAVTLNISIRYDNAIQVNSVGTAVGVGQATVRTRNDLATGVGTGGVSSAFNGLAL